MGGWGAVWGVSCSGWGAELLCSLGTSPGPGVPGLAQLRVSAIAGGRCGWWPAPVLGCCTMVCIGHLPPSLLWLHPCPGFGLTRWPLPSQGMARLWLGGCVGGVMLTVGGLSLLARLALPPVPALAIWAGVSEEPFRKAQRVSSIAGGRCGGWPAPVLGCCTLECTGPLPPSLLWLPSGRLEA